jgi:hypothetical protein
MALLREEEPPVQCACERSSDFIDPTAPDHFPIKKQNPKHRYEDIIKEWRPQVNHIQQAILELTVARNRAQELIEGLHQFQAGFNGALTAPTQKAAVALPVNTQRRQEPPEKVVIPRLTPEGEALMNCAAGLTEPFTNQQLAVAGKVTNKQAENFLNNRIGTRVFNRVGRGQFVRGVNFPAIGKTTNTNEAMISTDAGGISIGKALNEPFTLLDLSARLDGDSAKRAGAWLGVWQLKNWITQVGGNAYRRTKEFGK